MATNKDTSINVPRTKKIVRGIFTVDRLERGWKAGQRGPRELKHEAQAQKRCASYCSALRDGVLGRGRKWLNKIYAVSVPSVDTTAMSCKDLTRRVKEWMEGREVAVAFQGQGRREREGGKFAFRLLKKILPEPCGCFGSSSAAWIERQTRETTSSLPVGFEAHVQREVESMFPEGWDHSYVAAIAKYANPSSACVELSCKKGGSRRAMDVQTYLDGVAGERELIRSPLKYTEVLTAGKVRPLTIAPVEFNVLRPLHKIIFNRVAKQRWALIGSPSAKKMSRAGFRFEEPILSGDYKSATDSLDIRVSSLILRTILARAQTVPTTIKDFALDSLENLQVTVDKTLCKVRRGQMMGSLLSFPLLCIYNRVASSFALGRAPMLINGDDIVAETSCPEKWFDILPLLGMSPEESKTGYSSNRLEINSTPFIISQGKPLLCPVARIRSLVPRLETADVGARMESFSGNLYGAIRSRAEDAYISSKRGLIHQALRSGVPLPDLGFRGSHAIAALGRNGIIPLAVKFARQLHGSIPLPSCSPNGEKTLPIHGEIEEKTKDAINDTRALFVVKSFGTMTRDMDTREYLKLWWEELKESALSQSAPVVLARPGQRYYYGWVPWRLDSRFFGELLPLVRFRARLASALSAPSRAKLPRVHEDLAFRIPCHVRWGICVDQRPADNNPGHEDKRP